ncbi:hypothetical protein HOE67_02530 [Candidatus Peregrinibacteria bacterium]|jgi:hypothetical protein|nr:hypothetical protein [Candidatus Peregrinibacteria bacterium]MBT4055964.1 hypothetical protein [Candidatus Peregrinibacteria bacterium]
MVKNIILAISILLNVAVLVFAIWAYVTFNNGLFSHAMVRTGLTQMCDPSFQNDYLLDVDEKGQELVRNWCEKMIKCNEEGT